MNLTDTFGRKINYMRLSITDRCNMRCVYCMPPSGVSMLRHGEILSYEDLLLIARAAVSSGIEKIRVTGGEPLVRRDVVPFLKRLAEIPGLKQLVLTTNGVELAGMAADLKAAGVQRLNISLDSLDGETFSNVTRGGNLGKVLAGISAAEEIGFPIKINVVAMRGVNDREILDFAALTLNRPISVRFIEYMPAIKAENWESLVVPGGDILERIGERFSFTAQNHEGLAGPARTFRIKGAAGSFGIITPLTGHFCEECNRIRVTASGRVRGCLFSDSALDLRPLLASGNEEGLALALRAVVTCKPRRHLLSEEDDQQYTPFAMAALGG